ncbi:MAG TPA: hypothetical protein VH280_18875 [Verrucomicrobiae bacterium]|jgi:hypothetical protein|nr:hypothetical protein [Verrucomicrobiae bacterium]
MKKIILLAAAIPLAACVAAGQSSTFLPKHLAVLRAGDGAVKLHLKQSPVFVDEFAPESFNQAPVMTVAIPTNGADTIFFNGHAATEGMLSRSADGRFVTFAGYGGVNLLAQSGTPSLLDIGRAFCAVDAAGKERTIIYEQYGGTQKMNPRGAVTDGANHFWSCGNASGTAYYDAGGSGGPVTFAAVPDSRQVKIINGTLYTTLNGPDGVFLGVPSGIFSFVNGSGDAEPLPDSPKTKLSLVVQADKNYSKIAGFDMNPEGTIAYTADAEKGVQKYAKADGQWKFAYNFFIPQNIPAAANHEAGCFALTVDFTGSAPIVYATTTEGYNGCVNSNRVVRILDNGPSSKVTTVAQAKSTEVAYRGIAFTPDAK